jgi:hypothetical protein
MASAFAAIAMPADTRRFTTDWADDNERRAAARGGRGNNASLTSMRVKPNSKRSVRMRKRKERFAEGQRKIAGGCRITE